ncbi:MAG: hypothetical protein PVI86_13755 [Phycisphaerae bacterium]|jgi:hypothetical protein
MSKLQASWVHGSGVQIEREGYFISKQRTGYGAHFKTHGSEWFHFAVPTPVIVDGKRSSLTKVFVFYKTEGVAKITGLHIYDAGGSPFTTKIKALNNLSLAGDHCTSIDQANAWVVTPSHSMKYGLGLSVLVDFGPRSPAGVAGIWFVAAGADFQTP